MQAQQRMKRITVRRQMEKIKKCNKQNKFLQNVSKINEQIRIICFLKPHFMVKLEEVNNTKRDS